MKMHASSSSVVCSATVTAQTGIPVARPPWLANAGVPRRVPWRALRARPLRRIARCGRAPESRARTTRANARSIAMRALRARTGRGVHARRARRSRRRRGVCGGARRIVRRGGRREPSAMLRHWARGCLPAVPAVRPAGPVRGRSGAPSRCAWRASGGPPVSTSRLTSAVVAAALRAMLPSRGAARGAQRGSAPRRRALQARRDPRR